MEYVYIFDFGDKIKAGYSTNVEKRLRTIELSSGVKAKQVYSLEASRKVEKLLHSWLENRLEGEFFAFPFDIAKEILDKIQRGEITEPKHMEERKNSEARIRANNKYNAKAYDRINIAVPKGKKATIQAHADAQGQSVNGYINAAIDEKMERDGGAPGGSEGDTEE